MPDAAASLSDDSTRVLIIEASDEDHDDRQLGTFSLELARGVTEPFPDGAVLVEEAVRWGRSVADIVVLQLGGLQFSAGRLPEPNTPPWIDGTEVRAGRFIYEPPGPAVTHYWVRISGDGSPLDPELAARLRLSQDVREVREPAVGTLEVAVAQGDEIVDEVVGDLLHIINEELCPWEEGRQFERVDGRWVHPTYEFHQMRWRYSTIGPAG